jgi:hypothetical protein
MTFCNPIPQNSQFALRNENGCKNGRTKGNLHVRDFVCNFMCDFVFDSMADAILCRHEIMTSYTYPVQFQV